ncbi:MAG: elongation factor G [Alphaproteobacteria bacterium]|nr:elongation factor G [Alphaproteobacteria bacterium]
MAKTSYAPADLRNIALVGHGFSGKTSIAEAMLFNSGANSRLGKAGTSTSVFDFEPEEHDRGGSIGTSFGWMEHEGRKINIIDTPGDFNFIYDSFTAMRGADGAVVVVSAPDGVEVQTERVYHKAVELGIPRIIVINKMDHERADYETVLSEIEEAFGVKPVPLQVPIGQGPSFTGVVSLFQRKALTYKADGSGSYEKGAVPAALQDEVDAAYEQLVETVASSDDELLEVYLDTFELSEEQVKSGFQAALKRGQILPVLFTAGPLNVGVHALMDLVVWAVPSPLERGAVAASDSEGEPTEVMVSDSGDFYAQVIRTFNDDFSGKMTIFRVFAGETPGDGQVLNPQSGEWERLGALYSLRGNHRDPVEQGVPGDILAVAKLKTTHTNHSLTTSDQGVRLEGEQYPPPMMEYTIRPASRSDEGKLKVALERLCDEDPSLNIGYDELSHNITLRGMGQAHLDLSIAKLARKFKVNVESGLPAVPYRETLRRAVANIEGKHKKQTGGAGQFGVCVVNIEPLPRDGGFEFVDAISGGSIPRQYIPSVEKGLVERMKRGSLAGYPVVDIRVTLTDGKYHPVDSKDVAYQLAGSKALQTAMDKGGVKLLEPVYKMEIVVPSDNMGDVMGDITRRRGRVLGMDTKGRKTIIQAVAPLGEIQRYAPDLNAMTGGKGSYIMEFHGYEDVPGNLVDGIVNASPFKRHDDE